MTDLHFRSAAQSDWLQIAELLTRAKLPLDGAEAHLPGFILAFRGEHLIGCAALERYGATALLRSVAVTASERGTGLGDRKSTRLNSSHIQKSRMPSSA